MVFALFPDMKDAMTMIAVALQISLLNRTGNIKNSIMSCRRKCVLFQSLHLPGGGISHPQSHNGGKVQKSAFTGLESCKVSRNSLKNWK